MSDFSEFVVIGGGAIGLACARVISESGYEVIVLEQNDSAGAEISSRSSEVIHAGIYYPPRSLKAALCLRGKSLLYDYCQERTIPFNRCGKLVIATANSELRALDTVEQQAAANNVKLRRIGPEEIRSMEPEALGVAALYSESTGVFDSHSYVTSLLGDVERNGGVIAYRSKVEKIVPFRNEIKLYTASADLRCNWLINCAGLGALQLTGHLSKQKQPDWYAHGRYYSYSGKSPFSRLVYPIPNDAGLGIHYTVDWAGNGKFGPDVHWNRKIDYQFLANDGLKSSFVRSISRYYPAIDERRLREGYIGVRPKVVGPNEGPADFIIHGPKDHKVMGLINLFGIESPGLTASLAVAEYVKNIIRSS